MIAKKTRQTIMLAYELEGRDPMPVEEIRLELDQQGKKKKKRIDYRKYAPLIFEECYFKGKGPMKLLSAFELE